MINEENEWNGEVEVNIIQGPLDKVTKGEVITPIKAMNLRKAAGVSEVVTE